MMSKNKTSKKLAVFTITALVFATASFIFVFFLGFHQKADAQVGSTIDLYGAAWSESIGWISFNSCESESQNCGLIPYSVSVDMNNGHVTGAAWSENVGWLKFGGLSGFPIGQGTVAADAKMNLSEGPPAVGDFKGWARFCAGTSLGVCSTMDDSPDGWDGWVSLSGNLHPSPDTSGNGGVTYDETTGKIVGKAWGGDVVGWIDFWDVSFGPPQPFDYALSNPTEAPGSPVQVVQGGNGQVAVTRTLLSGDTEDVLLILGSLPSNISVSVDSNQPCLPTCFSILTITDISSGGLPLGPYSFKVSGDVLIDGKKRETEVRFEIIELPNPEPAVSCEATGGPFFIPGSSIVRWKANVQNPEGDEIFLWEGDDDLSCEGQLPGECQTVEKTYSTVGRKEARVSIDEGLNFSDCQTTIGVIMNFETF